MHTEDCKRKMTSLQKIESAVANSEIYSEMLIRMQRDLPATEKASEVFNKSSSQFKTTSLDVVDLTPISTARHLLASIARTRSALEEASIKYRKCELKLSQVEADILEADGYKKDRLLIQRDKHKLSLKNIGASARGAIRKVSFLMSQYDNVLEALGVDVISEEMYENDQVRYHIMTAFAQALHSARARGGAIDEGNLIYLFQLGINGASAQQRVTDLLKQEIALLKDGKEPQHEMVLHWLSACADVYASAPEKFMSHRLLTSIDKTLLIDTNDIH